MRVLSFDPGALRMGMAVLETGPTHIWSSYSLHSRNEDYQPYRLRLIEHWTKRTAELLKEFKPDLVMTEIVPPVGFGASGGNVQGQLAAAAITAVQAVTMIFEYPLKQISATTMKKRVAGDGRATKTKVRDGVLRLLPQLEWRRPEWTGKGAIFEEVDALGVGLAALGYKN